MFLGALHGARRVVVVDNTHTRKWEYDFYARMARIFQYRVAVVAIHCTPPAEDTAAKFAARCSHAVPVTSVLRMQRRWQPDASAIRVAPTWREGGADAAPAPAAAPAPGGGPTRRRDAGPPRGVYSAAFLTAATRKRVLEAFPAVHADVLAGTSRCTSGGGGSVGCPARLRLAALPVPGAASPP